MINKGKNAFDWAAYDTLELSDYKEYFIIDLIQRLQYTDASKHQGWCYMSRETMGKELRISKRTIQRYIQNLESKGLIEQNNTGFVRCVPDVYNLLKHGTKNVAHLLNDTEGGDTVSPVAIRGDKVVKRGVTKLFPGGDTVSPNIKEDIKERERGQISHSFSEIKQVADGYCELFYSLNSTDKLFEPQLRELSWMLERPCMKLDNAIQSLKANSINPLTVFDKFLRKHAENGNSPEKMKSLFIGFADTFTVIELQNRSTAKKEMPIDNNFF